MRICVVWSQIKCVILKTNDLQYLATILCYITEWTMQILTAILYHRHTDVYLPETVQDQPQGTPPGSTYWMWQVSASCREKLTNTKTTNWYQHINLPSNIWVKEMTRLDSHTQHFTWLIFNQVQYTANENTEKVWASDCRNIFELPSQISTTKTQRFGLCKCSWFKKNQKTKQRHASLRCWKHTTSEWVTAQSLS